MKLKNLIILFLIIYGILFSANWNNINVDLSGHYIGRLSLDNNKFYDTTDDIEVGTWRFDEFPENDAEIDLNVNIKELLDGKITLGAKTQKDLRSQTFLQKWYNWTLEFREGYFHAKVVNTEYADIDLMVFHNYNNIRLGTKIQYLNISSLFNDYLVISNYRKKYNPYLENYYMRHYNHPEMFGRGVQGAQGTLKISLSEYFYLMDTLIVGDDNTTSEDEGTLNYHTTSTNEKKVFLDKNQNSILDINEQDKLHHNFIYNKIDINTKYFDVSLFGLTNMVFEWEKQANLINPYHETAQKNEIGDYDGDGDVDEDDILGNSGLLQKESDTIIIRSAERRGMNVTLGTLLEIEIQDYLNIYTEVAFNEVSQKYVSKPKKTLFEDDNYDLNYIPAPTSVDIKWGTDNKSKQRGRDIKAGIKSKMGLLDQIDFAAICEYEMRTGVFMPNLFINPNDKSYSENIFDTYSQDKTCPVPINDQTNILHFNMDIGYNFKHEKPVKEFGAKLTGRYDLIKEIQMFNQNDITEKTDNTHSQIFFGLYLKYWKLLLKTEYLTVNWGSVRGLYPMLFPFDQYGDRRIVTDLTENQVFDNVTSNLISTGLVYNINQSITWTLMYYIESFAGFNNTPKSAKKVITEFSLNF